MRAGSWPAGARSPFEARSSPYASEGGDGARSPVRRRIGETMPDSDQPQVPAGAGGAVTAPSSPATLEWRLGVVESGKAWATALNISLLKHAARQLGPPVKHACLNNFFRPPPPNTAAAPLI